MRDCGSLEGPADRVTVKLHLEGSKRPAEVLRDTVCRCWRHFKAETAAAHSNAITVVSGHFSHFIALEMNPGATAVLF